MRASPSSALATDVALCSSIMQCEGVEDVLLAMINSFCSVSGVSVSNRPVRTVLRWHRANHWSLVCNQVGRRVVK